LIDQPGVHLLLANTHLFFHPKADLIRLMQAIICTKHLEKLKNDLLRMEHVNKVAVLLGGDFNSDPPSWAFKYVSNKSIPYTDLSEG
jgi:2',5'-phosphodiesterase